MSSQMLAYIKPILVRLWDICLLRRGPEDIPYSPPLFVLLLIVGLVLDNLRINLLLSELPLTQLAWVMLVHTVLMISLTAGLLAVFGYPSRIIQTLTALTGAGVILSALILPFDYVASLGSEKFTMVSLIAFSVQIWSLVIVGHILSHALSVNRLTGVVIAIGFYILGIATFGYLLPPVN